MIAQASLGALMLRTLLALGLVLAIIAVAYVAMKRRNAMGGMVAPRGLGRGLNGGAGRKQQHRRRSSTGIEVVGRVGLTRTNAAVAVKFGDRVVLVAAAEQGTTSVLAEMPADEWEELTEIREQIPTPLLDNAGEAPRPSFVEALRQATSRTV